MARDQLQKQVSPDSQKNFAEIKIGQTSNRR